MTTPRIGILGGGQLGAMLLQAGISFGLKFKVTDKDPDAVCSRLTNDFTVGSLLDYGHVLAFGRQCDIVTIEIEAVNVEALHQLEKEGKKVFPQPAIIEMVQDKWKQKQFLQSMGIPVVAGVLINEPSELKNHVSRLPAVLKLCRDGYDGRGVMMLRSAQDLETAFNPPSVLENLVDIDQEISVIVSRNADGAVHCFDPVAMVFDEEMNLLSYQLCPAVISESVKKEAIEMASGIAESLQLVGILAVEMFLTKSGELLVNEMAPRPHNSGHHSIEGCVTSQFEQLLRAILNLQPGETNIVAPSVMVNLVGKEHDLLPEEVLSKLLAMPDVHLHWYGKEARKGRKLGHITVMDKTLEAAVAKAQGVRKLLKQDDE